MKKELEIKQMSPSDKLVINNDLRKYLANVSGEQLRMLKKDILENGIIDPIDIWDGVIIDGHTRYNIAKQNKLPFKVRIHTKEEFKSVDDVNIWMIQKQIGRRNLNPTQEGILMAKYYSLRKKKSGGDRRSQKFQNLDGQSFENKTTAKETAEAFGVSESTVHSARQTKEIVDEVEKTFGSSAAHSIIEEKVKIPVKQKTKIKKGLKTGKYSSMEELLDDVGIKGSKKEEPVVGTYAYNKLGKFTRKTRLIRDDLETLKKDSEKLFNDEIPHLIKMEALLAIKNAGDAFRKIEEYISDKFLLHDDMKEQTTSKHVKNQKNALLTFQQKLDDLNEFMGQMEESNMILTHGAGRLDKASLSDSVLLLSKNLDGFKEKNGLTEKDNVSKMKTEKNKEIEYTDFETID